MSSLQLDKAMMGEVKEDRDSMFSVASRNRARGNGHKLTQKKIHLNIKPPHIALPGWLSTGIGYPKRLESPSMEIIPPG